MSSNLYLEGFGVQAPDAEAVNINVLARFRT